MLPAMSYTTNSRLWFLEMHKNKTTLTSSIIQEIYRKLVIGVSQIVRFFLIFKGVGPRLDKKEG